MNDTRIRELAREAGIKLMNDEALALGYLPATQKKFARLIVEECVKCSGDLIKHYIETHCEQEQVLLLASIADYTNEIKKHFGM